jgi:superfamily II DNA/RNA helicase
MDGTFAPQQRAIKMIDTAQRMAIHAGVGSGKTLIALGAHTHLHSKGAIAKTIMAVPSAVQGQIPGEILRYTDPGKVRFFATPGADREARIRALADPNTHLVVSTHQSLRDDLVHLIAQHSGQSPTQVAALFRDSSQKDTHRRMLRAALQDAGIPANIMTVLDEGHTTLDRMHKDDSLMSNVFTALSHPENSTHHVLMTGSPLKNDVSEIFSTLQKLHPERYTDREAFMAQHAILTPSVRESLQRKVADAFYATKVSPTVPVTHRVIDHQPSPAQQAALREITQTTRALHRAQESGQVDIDAATRLAPAAFANLPASLHADRARQLQEHRALVREAAIARVLHSTPYTDNTKMQDVVRYAKERVGAGKPGIIFAHNREAVKALHEALKAEGIKVAMLTGAHSAREKGRIRNAFQPEHGQPSVDVLVMSDAGATGMNLQRGEWVHQYDIPDTQMIKEQRDGRIHRLGQTHPVELSISRMAVPHDQRAWERLQTKAHLAEVFQSPADLLDDTGIAAYVRQKHHREQEHSRLLGVAD